VRRLMHILIIGGTGFLGRTIHQQLTAERCPHTIIGRRNTAPPWIDTTCGSYARIEPHNPFLRERVPKASVVIDLAYGTVPKTSFADPLADLYGNLPFHVEIFQEAAQLGVHKYLFVSTGGAVYDDREPGPYKESAELRPVAPYGITKLALEHYGMAFLRTLALPFVVVRPSTAFGPHQEPFRGQGLIASILGAALIGRQLDLFGGAEIQRDYIFSEDLANAIIQLSRAGLPGEVYNAGTGISVTHDSLLTSVRAALSEREMVLPAPRRLPRREFDLTSNILDSSKLRALTGFKCHTSFLGGIRDTLTWLGTEWLPRHQY
jgi:UDP-glucose 4-epimerase